LELPKLDVGDLVVGRAMGAYTWASRLGIQTSSPAPRCWRSTAVGGHRQGASMTWSRRRVLAAGGALAACRRRGCWQDCAQPGDAANQAAARGQDGEHRVVAPKRIALLNLHTDERLDMEYFRDGIYVPAALSPSKCCERFPTGERHPIDPA